MRACHPSYEGWDRSASGLVVDFDSVRSFSVLQPVRRFIYGLALCFLAALLATEAKAAWAANGAGVPSDISAVKLWPEAMKQVASRGQTASRPMAVPIRLACLSVDRAAALPPASCEPFESRLRLSIPVARLLCFSPSLFLRPPPSSKVRL